MDGASEGWALLVKATYVSAVLDRIASVLFLCLGIIITRNTVRHFRRWRKDQLDTHNANFPSFTKVLSDFCVGDWAEDHWVRAAVGMIGCLGLVIAAANLLFFWWGWVALFDPELATARELLNAVGR